MTEKRYSTFIGGLLCLRCSGCGEVKPVTAFGLNKSTSDGYQSLCKACRKSYRDSHKEELSLKSKEYRESHKEQIAAKKHADYVANPEPMKAAARRSVANRKEEVAAYQKQYQIDHHDEIYLLGKQWNEAHPEEVRAYKTKWAENNPDKVREARLRRREQKRISDQSMRKTVAWCENHKDDPCYYCGRRTDDMTNDHYYPLVRGGTNHWFNLVRACRSCNSSKNDRLASELQ